MLCLSSQFHLFYQNFNEIDGKLSQMSQTIFDLLKVVHILDLERIYWPTNRSVLKIKSIEKRPDFIDYYRKHLKQMREEKEKTKEVVKQLTQKLDKRRPDGSQTSYRMKRSTDYELNRNKRFSKH